MAVILFYTTVAVTIMSSIRAASRLTFMGSTGQSRQGLSELPWTDFFDQELLLHQETGDLAMVHHAYLTSPATQKAPLFVTHHGAGSSGLSFAALAVEIRKLLPDAGILSLDARGHGKTGIPLLVLGKDYMDYMDKPSDYVDLTLGTLSHDLEFILNATQERMKWDSLPDIVLVGHSLGGAVVTDLAKNGGLGSKILGYAVLDVVESSRPNSGVSKVVLLTCKPRICYGCSPEYGNLPFHSSSWFPLHSRGYRMAVSYISE